MTDDRIPPEALAYLDEFRAWAIGDDYDRCAAVEAAPRAESERLVGACDALPEAVWEWLANPPDPEDTPQAYYDITDITMAAEYANGVLEPPPTVAEQARRKANVEELLELLRRRQGLPPDQW